MKLSLILLIFSLTSISQAVTNLQFFPGDRNAMVILIPQDSLGNKDNDSVDLYKLMNVPEQNTMFGKGKSVISPGREFQLVCSQYKNQCQVILTKAASTQIQSSKKYMSFSVSGEPADQLRLLFHLDSASEFQFQSVDRRFRIFAKASSFSFEALEL